MSVKEHLHDLIDTLPDDDTAYEKLQYQLYVISKVNNGLAEIDAGQGVPHEQAVQRMQRWLAQ